MPEDIAFTMPGETPTAETTTETTATDKPVIDPATGEPTLAPQETAAAAEAPAETPKPVSTPDADAALAVAARSSREARELKKQLAAAQEELTKLKSAPVSQGDDYKAKYEAIKRNPALLYSEGWEGDKLMKALLDPDSANAPQPIDKEALKRELLEEIKAAQAETPEQKSAREASEKAEREQGFVKAAAYVDTVIKSESETHYWVDSDDARSIAEKVVAFCETKGINPSREVATDLIRQGIKKLHDLREKRFAARGISRGGSQKPSNVQGAELDFTDQPQTSGKLRVVTESAKPTPKVPGQTGNPLSTKKPVFQIDFT